MKYIKLFETIRDSSELPAGTKFKIGDYVRIKRGQSFAHHQHKMFKIYTYDEKSDLWQIHRGDKFDYYLYFPTKDLIKLTKKEIENFLLEDEAEKYNL